jgi:hypothetical protein
VIDRFNLAGFQTSLTSEEIIIFIYAVLAVDRIDFRNRLSERDMNNLTGVKSLIEFIGYCPRAILSADTASRAEILTDITRLSENSRFEVAGFTAQANNLGIGHQFDIRMPTGIHHPRSENSYRAVHRRECLVELRHSSADGWRLLDKVDLNSARCEVESRLYAGYSTTYDQYTIGHHVTFDFFTRYRSGNRENNLRLSLSRCRVTFLSTEASAKAEVGI